MRMLNLHNCILGIVLIIYLFISSCHPTNEKSFHQGQEIAVIDGFSQNMRLGRGVNVMGYDPIWDDFDKARIKSSHFKKIKEAGFDNIRLKISPFRFSLDSTFTIDSKFFTVLDWGIEQALANDLMVIVDFHEHEAMGADPKGTEPMFLAMWQQLAEHLRNQPMEVLFEVANEPNMQPEIWNELYMRAHSIIRETNPSRTLLIGPVHGNQIKNLQYLELPENDHNLIIAIHYYSPIQFTHQGAPWSKNNKHLSGITWEGTVDQKNSIKEDFNIASDWALLNNRPLTLGEFGAYEKAELGYRVLWTDFVARQADMRGWSWSYWQFDKDFILYEIEKDDWFYPIKNALIPPDENDIRSDMVYLPLTGPGSHYAHKNNMTNDKLYAFE